MPIIGDISSVPAPSATAIANRGLSHRLTGGVDVSGMGFMIALSTRSIRNVSYSCRLECMLELEGTQRTLGVTE